MVSNEPTFLLDWAPDAVIVTGADKSVAYVNPRAEDLFGYRNEELKDKPLELLIPEGLGSGTVESSPRQHVSRTVICAHRDGTRFRATARWRPVPAAEGGFVVFSVRDLEGEERAGESGVPRRRGERGRVDLVALIAHDVRESLQAVQYLCDALRGRAPAEAATVREIVGSLCRLLERFTRFPEATAIEPIVEPCRVDELLATLGRELMPLAERKGLRFSVDGAEQVIMTDPVLLRELLHNLASNAIRYTATGSVDIRCRADAELVRIEISDTGVGIADDRLAALLTSERAPSAPDAEPDRTLDDTLARDLRAASPLGDPGAAAEPERAAERVGGDPPHGDRPPFAPAQRRGLGLAIVHQLAQLLDCTLEVDSSVGRGSRFTVIAPRDLGGHGLRLDRNGG
ncbi:MAG TPA: PAS domain-containing sensor histidine kinase [Gammaproteobacteria bacterium]